MSLQERVSLIILAFVIFVVCGLEIVVLLRSIDRRVHGRFAWKILFAKPALVLHALVVTGFVCLLYGYFIEPRWIDVSRMTLHTAQLSGPGFRIVQISDLHCDERPRNEEAAVQIINDLEPDVVVVTGDFLNHSGGLVRLREMLARIEAPLGKFAVTGNFEVHRWPQLDALEGSGFRRLERETVVVTKGSDTIAFFGMGYTSSEDAADAVETLPDDDFDVLLFHTPDLVEELRGRGVDLYLCGHTHGGQVALPLYGALVTFSKFGKKYESGMYLVGDTVLYVNRGLGMEPRPAPQVRFCARPEIAVFDILPEAMIAVQGE